MILFKKEKNKSKNEIFLIEKNIIYKYFKKPKIPLKLYAQRKKNFFKLSNGVV